MPQLSEENRLELENALSSLKSSSRQAIESAVTVALRFRKEHYKEVAHLMEKHLHKTKIERKLPALYAIDLLFNKAAQGGKSNPFPKRFEKNIKETFAQLRQCKKEELFQIAKVAKLWSQKDMFSTETNSYLVEIATEFAAKSGKSLPENLSLSQGTANTPATKPSSHKSKSEVKHNVPDIPNPVALPSFSPPRQIPAFGYPEIRLASMGGTPASEINVNKPVTSLFDYDDEEDEDSRLEAQVKQVERDRMKASEPEIYDEVNRIQAPHTARTDQMYSAYAPQEEQHYEYDLKPKRPYEYPPEMPKSDPYSGQYQGSMNHWNMSRSQDATPTRPLHYEDNRTPNIERRGSISGQHMPYEDFVDSRGPNYDRRGSISGTEPYTSDYGRPRSSRWDNDGPQQQYSQPNFTSPRNNGSRTRDYDRYDDYDSRKRGRY